MGYAQATARLRCAITKVAATGTAPLVIVREVFGDVSPQSASPPIVAVSPRPCEGSGRRQETTLAQAAASNLGAAESEAKLPGCLPLSATPIGDLRA